MTFTAVGVSPPAFANFFGHSSGQCPARRACMAQTEHLPIYKGTYDLCLYLEQVVHNFSRYHKYTLGADLRDGASISFPR